MLLLRSSLAVTVLLLLAVPQLGLALEGLVLDPERDEVRLDAYVEYLEDAGERLTIEQVASPAFDARFRPSPGAGFNAGLTRSAWWLRFRLRDTGTSG